ncbi:hypothetical protein DPMN_024209 [Dreissena polymorpha]|uniref:Uncharacterized protein n=1 Tax=Dreissena polymorpha TaxID=45954 RepID=A0A9D4LPB6_DREPO|nr:hypothetical protein DPMN_024209 [Dreissena polymorpha]
MSKFHEDWAKNVSSRLFTCFHYIHIKKNAPPPGGHVFSLITTIFKLVRDIHITNEKDLPPGGHVFLPIQTIFELNCRIQKTAPPPGGHVFPPIMTIFKFVRDIYKIEKTHFLTKFHEDWTKNVTSRVFTCFHYIQLEKTAPPPGGHAFLPIWTIFELVRDINETNVLTKFHDDWAKIVTSRVNTAPPNGGHVFNGPEPFLNSTDISLRQTFRLSNMKIGHQIFELSRGINRTNTINVASAVFTRQNVDHGRLTTRDGKKGDHKSSP